MIVCVASYPRSGQVWLSRLIARACGGRVESRLEADVGRDIAAESFGKSDVVVHRTHDVPPLGADPGAPMPHRIVRLFRDPRDCLLSNYRYRFAQPGDGGVIECHRRMFVNGGWADHVTRWLDDDDWHGTFLLTVRYEELRKQPALTLHYLLQQLELPTDRIDAALDAENIERRRQALARGDAPPGWTQGSPEVAVGQAQRHLGPGHVGQWRDQLPPDLARDVAERCVDLMLRLGYE